MAHPDEGTIRAFLDGEAGGDGPALRAHLAECSRCAAVAAEQEETLSVLSDGLSLLDVPPAPARVRSRLRDLDQETGKRHRLLPGPGSLPKAASVAVFLTVGAAAALPGSPVRDWFRAGWDALLTTGSSGPEATLSAPPPVAPDVTATGDLEMVGASLPLKDRAVTVRIHGREDGAGIRVLLVDDAQVGVFARMGTRFRTETGLIEAQAAPGPVTVEIPRDAGQVEVFVDGVLFLRQQGGETTVLGPVTSRAPHEILFGPPAEPGVTSRNP